jgi:hypothetical protein
MQHTAPPTSLGNIYPRGDVLAVIDDRESAERAVRSLTDAGLPADAVFLLDGPTVLEAYELNEQQRGSLQRFEAWLSAAFSDDAAYAEEYALEARRGHYMVVVHAAREDLIERISKVLHSYGAHAIRHYELLTVTEL